MKCEMEKPYVWSLAKTNWSEELKEYFCLDDERRFTRNPRHLQMQAHIDELHCQLVRKHASDWEIKIKIE